MPNFQFEVVLHFVKVFILKTTRQMEGYEFIKGGGL